MTHLLSTLAIAALVATPAHTETPVPEEAQVVAAMKIMFIAAANDDLAYFNTVAAPDFYAFDGGKRYTADSLMKLIRKLHADGSVYVWTVTNPEVHVSGDIAWITYVNRGSVKNTSGKKNVAWLESAVLRKEAGSWRIHFFHSTSVP
jgi:ketosteroid isomerase-like protein